MRRRRIVGMAVQRALPPVVSDQPCTHSKAYHFLTGEVDGYPATPMTLDFPSPPRSGTLAVPFISQTSLSFGLLALFAQQHGALRGRLQPAPSRSSARRSSALGLQAAHSGGSHLGGIEARTHSGPKRPRSR